MPCPWYRMGYCTSPRLRAPTAAVVSAERCASDADYRSCEYYVEEEGERGRRGLEGHLRPAVAQQLRPYPPIHVVSHRPRSGCPHMKVYDYGGGYLAYCNVLGRLLTKSEVRTCEDYWSTCPLRHYA